MKKTLNSRAKGARGERDFIEDVCTLLGRERCARDRRNWQWTNFGGTNNPDVELDGLKNMHFEVKNTQTFCFPAWTKKLREECGGKLPVLAYKEPRKGFWLLLRLEDIEDFCVTWAEALGWKVSK